MNTYRIEVAPAIRYRVWGPSAGVTKPQLEQAIEGIDVREIASLPNGNMELDVQLGRDTHAAALGEVVRAAEFLGFELIKAKVTEWATSWVEGVFIGAGGGALLGSGTRQAIGVVVGLGVGAVLGGAFGFQTPKVKATYTATRDYYGNWKLTLIVEPPPPAVAPAWSDI